MPLLPDGNPKLTRAQIKAMRLMAMGFGLYLSATGQGWMLTDGTKVAGTVANSLLNNGWAGDKTLGFSRLTIEGKRVLDAQPVDTKARA